MARWLRGDVGGNRRFTSFGERSGKDDGVDIATGSGEGGGGRRTLSPWLNVDGVGDNSADDGANHPPENGDKRGGAGNNRARGTHATVLLKYSAEGSAGSGTATRVRWPTNRGSEE